MHSLSPPVITRMVLGYKVYIHILHLHSLLSVLNFILQELYCLVLSVFILFLMGSYTVLGCSLATFIKALFDVIINAGGSRGVGRVTYLLTLQLHLWFFCVCLSACPSVRALKGKWLELLTPSRYMHIPHGRPSAHIDLEVKKSKVKVTALRSALPA